MSKAVNEKGMRLASHGHVAEISRDGEDATFFVLLVALKALRQERFLPAAEVEARVHDTTNEAVGLIAQVREARGYED